ncbi:unnamed protein product [Larinioides sclopetarius]|uniref:Succinate dehydrogenase subunit 4 n=1 Tax=Larinioides sclopetarius TaxID=280406 RepID=A0AAV2AHN6_9ARAC
MVREGCPRLGAAVFVAHKFLFSHVCGIRKVNCILVHYRLLFRNWILILDYARVSKQRGNFQEGL